MDAYEVLYCRDGSNVEEVTFVKANDFDEASKLAKEHLGNITVEKVTKKLGGYVLENVLSEMIWRNRFYNNDAEASGSLDAKPYKYLATLIGSDEEPRLAACLPATVENKKRPIGHLIVTNKRVIYARKALFGSFMFEAPLEGFEILSNSNPLELVLQSPRLTIVLTFKYFGNHTMPSVEDQRMLKRKNVFDNDLRAILGQK